jgi:type IV pilus assembly protein PilF
LALVLLGFLAGCGTPPATTTSSRVEPLTESDEPEARKRARIRTELAMRYFENNQTSVALDEIKQALVADPAYGPAYVLRGLAYMQLKNEPLAEDSFQRALRINPKDADALHNYGWFVCNQGRHQLAIDQFTRALAQPLYGGQAKTYMAKGICQVRAGRADEAQSSFARSYELDPSNPISAYNLAQLLHQRGEDLRAQFYIRRLNNSEQANAETLWLGIKVERRLRNQPVVEQLAQQLGRRYPGSREWSAYQRGAFHE